MTTSSPRQRVACLMAMAASLGACSGANDEGVAAPTASGSEATTEPCEVPRCDPSEGGSMVWLTAPVWGDVVVAGAPLEVSVGVQGGEPSVARVGVQVWAGGAVIHGIERVPEDAGPFDLSIAMEGWPAGAYAIAPWMTRGGCVYHGGSVEFTIAAAACAPDCEGRACGDDGCGGSCGACVPGVERCEAGACLDSSGPVGPPERGGPFGNILEPQRGTVLGPGPLSLRAEVNAGGHAPLSVWLLLTRLPDHDAFVKEQVVGATGEVNTAELHEVVDTAGWAPGAYRLRLHAIKGALYWSLDMVELQFEPPCVPKCNRAQCGDDGCGGACGACQDGATCVGGPACRQVRHQAWYWCRKAATGWAATRRSTTCASSTSIPITTCGCRRSRSTVSR